MCGISRKDQRDVPYSWYAYIYKLFAEGYVGWLGEALRHHRLLLAQGVKDGKSKKKGIKLSAVYPTAAKYIKGLGKKEKNRHQTLAERFRRMREPKRGTG